MATIEERYKMIEASVMREAQEKADALTTQKNNFRKAAFDKAEDEVLREMYSRIQDEISDIRGNATRSVSREEAKYRQNLLLRREEITRAVFQQVRTRLLAYAKTDEYSEFIFKLATDMAGKYPLDNSVVLIRADDYHMAAEMDKIFSGKCRIMADDG
ncbi:MAG: V-type ATP synthase subunit E family protein, partial [Angelakisella sp.]